MGHASDAQCEQVSISLELDLHLLISNCDIDLIYFTLCTSFRLLVALIEL
jgi:hypothetical protein